MPIDNSTIPGSVVSHLDQVTAAWLTSVLARSGALTRGAVESFAVGTGRGNWSSNASLLLKYTSAAQGPLPRRLFLKMVNTDLGDESFGDSEVTYYTRDYVDVANAPLLHCYDAAYAPALKRYHILLDDVSETHVAASEKEPTLEYGLALAEALAVLHARWWGAGRLAEAGAEMHRANHIRNFVAIAEPGVGHIVGCCAAQLESHWPDLMRELFARHPQAMIERTRNSDGFTLIHGDAGEYNILVPQHGDRPLYLIDRQPFDWSLTVWLGVYDLVYATVLDWATDSRRRWELPILQHYHTHLIKHGVRDYAWSQLLYDYRLCVPMGVYIAVEYCRGGVNEAQAQYWRPMLQRVLTACEDLDCRALWW